MAATLAMSQNEPPSYCGDFWEKNGPSKLLLSSAHRGWSGLTAELRSHGKGVIPWKGPLSDTHICVDVHGGESRITRQGASIEQRIITTHGTVWLTPPRWREGSIDIADDLPGILHLYLSPSQFSPSKLGIDIEASSLGEQLAYDTSFEDPLVGEMARAIATELKSETSAGRLMVDSLTNSMVVRLVQKHIRAPQSLIPPSGSGLDRRRLLRVLDYIESNLEGDITFDRMASIACLSRYHFARAFKRAVGQSPYRYVSGRRLERAKALLLQGERSLLDIALGLSFSSQANFTRAFTQATGQSPGRYRQMARSQRSDFSPVGISRPTPTLARDPAPNVSVGP
ncbi:AraC family transcriptional regulator [Bradyrhizobium mercantei]|uniref:AraC family transcriptional regulator n=1 Tax=Bradyrhizobium mercantei TaxID=1904807 RepID=UPI001FD91D8E|nr:AraC family transcriptional regulator [Bradyrhizobium mercantei]